MSFSFSDLACLEMRPKLMPRPDLSFRFDGELSGMLNDEGSQKRPSRRVFSLGILLQVTKRLGIVALSGVARNASTPTTDPPTAAGTTVGIDSDGGISGAASMGL